MGKDKISMKAVQGRIQAAECLEEFAGGLRAGTILMEQGEESMTLCPPEVVSLKVQSKITKDKQKFVLEVVWNTDQDRQAIRITPVDEKTVPVKTKSTIPATTESASVPVTRKKARVPAKSVKTTAQSKAPKTTSKSSPKSKK